MEFVWDRAHVDQPAASTYSLTVALDIDMGSNYGWNIRVLHEKRHCRLGRIKGAVVDLFSGASAVKGWLQLHMVERISGASVGFVGGFCGRLWARGAENNWTSASLTLAEIPPRSI